MRPVVIVGIGELGSVFARGLLRCGHAVIPVTRERTVAEVAAAAPDPRLVLVAVGERDLHPVLEGLPAEWRDRVGLLQNELRPRDWLAHGIAEPTVAVVWFEKKPNSLVKELLPTVLHGKNAALLSQALAVQGIHTREAEDPEQLVLELVAKNLYILVTNIAGLECGGSVRQLIDERRELAQRVARDVLALESQLVGRGFDENLLWARFSAAVDADPEHACTGRSAPARLARALAHADAADLPVSELRRIAALHGVFADGGRA